jgi:hypothetical protein
MLYTKLPIKPNRLERAGLRVDQVDRDVGVERERERLGTDGSSVGMGGMGGMVCYKYLLNPLLLYEN